MKKCAKCGYCIENDNAKFCKKCGAKQQDIVVDKQERTAFNQNENDGILLNQASRTTPTSDEGHTLSSGFANDNPIPNVSASVNVMAEGKGLMWAVKTCFRNYANFNGRASRSEYWFFYLFNCIISSMFLGLAMVVSVTIIWGLLAYSLIVFLPTLAVTFRRLHDIGKSGWFCCIVFIPYIGAFILLYFLCKKSDSGRNLYGMPN